MKYLDSLNNCSDSYREYSNKILKDAGDTLNRVGIKVFPNNLSVNSNVDSYNVTNKDNKEDDKEKKSTQKSTDVASEENVKAKQKTTEQNDYNWIRESLPTSNVVSSLSSKLKNQSALLLGQTISNAQNSGNIEISQEDSDSDLASFDEFDVRDAESHINNIDELSNASDDQGAGNPLQTLFEKDLNDGFKTYNFLGTNYEIMPGSSETNICVYSDNLYQKKKTSIIFGGTTHIACQKTNSSGIEVDYNAYAFGKHKLNKFTLGAGVMGTGKDNVNNVYISLGAMHNQSKIYAILRKEIMNVPGLPIQSHTNVNVGIGNSSGYLDSNSYQVEDESIEEINDIDDINQNIENKQSDIIEPDASDGSNKLSNTTANLIFNRTNNGYEIGVKGGYNFKFTTKNKNHYFVMPYGQISNISVDSYSTSGEASEGAKFILGADAGKTSKLRNGWELKTKAVVEASYEIATGAVSNSYILGNVNFKARKKNFSGEFMLGGYYTKDKTFCANTELKAEYDLNKNISLYLKGGVAGYKFDNDSDNKGNHTAQIAVGGHFNF